MPVPAFLRPPRHLIALFLLITLVPSVLLIAFGWRLLQQDRALSQQQSQGRREQAADLVVAALEQSVSAAEQSLRDATKHEARSLAEEAVAVIATPGRVEAYPTGRLLYYPLASAGAEAAPQVFATGEELEYRREDYAQAASWFRDLARSSDRAVQAGALIRLARNLRKRQEYERALATYAQVAGRDGAAVNGVPADLLARWARCDLLAIMDRPHDLQDEAKSLYADLQHGRWQIDRATYELHVADARRWLGGDPPSTVSADAGRLAGAVEWIWNTWRRMPTEDSRSSRREAIAIDGAQLTILWEGNRDRLAALVAGPTYIERQWLRKLAPLLERQHVRLTLRDQAYRAANAAESRRTAGDTGLPWTVVVEDVNGQAELDRVAGRSTLWLAGLAILAAVVIGGTAVVARAVGRELTVARLQSDFVSAVSHEFRTPLTSLGQLTEVLLDRRITAEDRRHTYYQALARQTERLHRLVESLLDFGRMEAGASPYRLEPLDACALIGSVVEQFELEAAGRGYHVELHGLDKATARIAGDREALTNALWNLLDNAVKYSADCHTVWVNVERGDGRLAIHVRDRGLGIPHDEQTEIFRKFVRGAGATAQGIKGTGIGLAMVRHIVEAHGGDVSVRSEPGAGSTFTMVLPTHYA